METILSKSSREWLRGGGSHDIVAILSETGNKQVKDPPSFVSKRAWSLWQGRGTINDMSTSQDHQMLRSCKLEGVKQHGKCTGFWRGEYKQDSASTYKKLHPSYWLKCPWFLGSAKCTEMHWVSKARMCGEDKSGDSNGVNKSIFKLNCLI